MPTLASSAKAAVLRAATMTTTRSSAMSFFIVFPPKSNIYVKHFCRQYFGENPQKLGKEFVKRSQKLFGCQCIGFGNRFTKPIQKTRSFRSYDNLIIRSALCQAKKGSGQMNFTASEQCCFPRQPSRGDAVLSEAPAAARESPAHGLPADAPAAVPRRERRAVRSPAGWQ